MKVSRIKVALLLSVAFGGAGCVMSSTPTGPVGMSSKTVATIAGQAGVMGSTNATRTGATFSNPAGMVYVASTNSIYIADSGNSTIRQLNLTNGNVSLFAGYPGVASWSDNAGTPYQYAYFNHPEGITSDGTYLYVADSGNNVIRRVVISGVTAGAVDTIAGNPGTYPPGFANGTGSNALFNNPLGICYDSTTPSLYVADSGNSAIRQITTLTGAAFAAVVTTVAGSPTSSTFYAPEGITIDSTHTNLYVVDAGYGTVLQIFIAGSVVTTIAGQPGVKGDVDATTGGAAQFNWPEGIVIDSTNTYLYVADTLNSVIRRVTISGGAVTTLAGQGQVTGSSDGAGDVATFNHPMRVLVNAANLYVADTYNQTIRLIQ